MRSSSLQMFRCPLTKPTAIDTKDPFARVTLNESLMIYPKAKECNNTSFRSFSMVSCMSNLRNINTGLEDIRHDLNREVPRTTKLKSELEELKKDALDTETLRRAYQKRFVEIRKLLRAQTTEQFNVLAPKYLEVDSLRSELEELQKMTSEAKEKVKRLEELVCEIKVPSK